MKKLVVSNYPSGDQTYDVKRSLVTLLFHPELKLDAYDTLKAQKLADKIDAAEDVVLLEDAEYERVRAGLEVTRGFSQHDVPLIQRILDAETV